MDTAKAQGQADCLQNPLSCGIDVQSACPVASLDAELNLHLPLLVYQSLFADLSLWADLRYQAQRSGLVFQVIDFGELDAATTRRAGDYTQADVDAAYQAGQQLCVADPHACGITIQTSTSCQAATLSIENRLHIPQLHYYTPFGVQKLWVDMQLVTDPNAILFGVVDYGLNPE